MNGKNIKGKIFQVRNAPWTFVSMGELTVFVVFWAQLALS